MRRRRRFRRMLAFLLVLTISIAMYLTMRHMAQSTLQPLEDYPRINLQDGQGIHLSRFGWMRTGLNPLFYDWYGNNIEPDQSVQSVISATEHYFAADGGRIFGTKSLPFDLIYENDGLSIAGLYEFEGFLLVLARDIDAEHPAKPYLLMEDSSFLLPLDGLGSTHFLSADAQMGSREFSLLAFSFDTPAVTSRIFHYDSFQRHHGLISLDAMLIVDLYRIQDYIILVGNDRVLCYNMNGILNWEIRLQKQLTPTVIKGADQVLLYYREPLSREDRDSNVIRIQGGSEPTLLDFPMNLSHMQLYKRGYMGIEYNHTLVFLDRQGRVTGRQPLEEAVRWAGWSEHQPELVFVITTDHTLKVYTTRLRKDEQE